MKSCKSCSGVKKCICLDCHYNSIRCSCDYMNPGRVREATGNHKSRGILKCNVYEKDWVRELKWKWMKNVKT